jgi:hypothetical protein
MPVTTAVPTPPPPSVPWVDVTGRPTPAMQQFMVALLALVKEMRDAIP